MPTLGAHFPDEEANLIEQAARLSEEKKVGPWLVNAARQRLERDGMMPGNPRAELLVAVEEIGMEAALALLTKAPRSKQQSESV